MTASIPQGNIQILNMSTQRVLDAGVDVSGQPIVIQNDKAASSQRWQLQLARTAGGVNYYHIKSADDEKYITAMYPDPSKDINGTHLTIGQYEDDASIWSLEFSDGSVFFRNPRYDRVISVYYGNPNDVILWSCDGGPNHPNQKWQLVLSEQPSPVAPVVADRRFWGGFGPHSAPLCKWKPVPAEKNDRSYIPIIVELFGAPLSTLPGFVPYNKRTKITKSTKSSSGTFQGGTGTETVGVSAAIVRPGRDYNPQMQYKATLYSELNYEGNMLVLSIGVYPDLDSFFCDRTRSVLFEEGVPFSFEGEDDYAAADSYYTNPPKVQSG